MTTTPAGADQDLGGVATPGAGTGRRLYIHRDSLRSAAQRDPHSAAAIAHAMWSMRLIKQLNHRLFDDPALLGVAAPDPVVDQLRLATGLLWPRITTLLRRATVSRSRNRPHEATRVLQASEHVTASCFFDGYYTFATGPAAAKEMFEDTRGMKEVRTTPDDDGTTPLTVVRGPRLYIPRSGGKDDTAPLYDLAQAREDIRRVLEDLEHSLSEASLDENWLELTWSTLIQANRVLDAEPL